MNSIFEKWNGNYNVLFECKRDPSVWKNWARVFVPMLIKVFSRVLRDTIAAAAADKKAALTLRKHRRGMWTMDFWNSLRSISLTFRYMPYNSTDKRWLLSFLGWKKIRHSSLGSFPIYNGAQWLDTLWIMAHSYIAFENRPNRNAIENVKWAQHSCPF